MDYPQQATQTSCLFIIQIFVATIVIVASISFLCMDESYAVTESNTDFTSNTEVMQYEQSPLPELLLLDEEPASISNPEPAVSGLQRMGISELTYYIHEQPDFDAITYDVDSRMRVLLNECDDPLELGEFVKSTHPREGYRLVNTTANGFGEEMREIALSKLKVMICPEVNFPEIVDGGVAWDRLVAYAKYKSHGYETSEFDSSLWRRKHIRRLSIEQLQRFKMECQTNESGLFQKTVRWNDDIEHRIEYLEEFKGRMLWSHYHLSEGKEGDGATFSWTFLSNYPDHIISDAREAHEFMGQPERNLEDEYVQNPNPAERSLQEVLDYLDAKYGDDLKDSTKETCLLYGFLHKAGNFAEFLRENPDSTHFGFVESWLSDFQDGQHKEWDLDALEEHVLCFLEGDPPAGPCKTKALDRLQLFRERVAKGDYGQRHLDSEKIIVDKANALWDKFNPNERRRLFCRDRAARYRLRKLLALTKQT